jgi:hypothetical protein
MEHPAMRWSLAIVFSVVVILSLVAWTAGNEPGWTSRILVPESEEVVRQATPILNRPYRPLHFYGNTVRRMHYHGRVRPTLTEVRHGFQAWAARG